MSEEVWHLSDFQWGSGVRVRKRSGSSWQGRIVGFYSTDITPVGYAVESEREPGSVQIYPEAALELVPDADQRESDTHLAFAAAHVGVRGKLHISVSTTSFYANDARKSIGEAFDPNWQEGWKKAKLNGYRIIKVSVSPSSSAQEGDTKKPGNAPG